MNLRILGALMLDWACSTFGDKVAQNRGEHAMRLFEEVAELAQAAGVAKEKAAAILERAYGRPLGEDAKEDAKEAAKEAAQVLVTLVSYCALRGIDLEAEFEREVARCIAKKDELKAKHETKVLAGTTSVEAGTHWAMCVSCDTSMYCARLGFCKKEMPTPLSPDSPAYGLADVLSDDPAVVARGERALAFAVCGRCGTPDLCRNDQACHRTRLAPLDEVALHSEFAKLTMCDECTDLVACWRQDKCLIKEPI